MSAGLIAATEDATVRVPVRDLLDTRSPLHRLRRVAAGMHEEHGFRTRAGPMRW